MCKRCPLLAEAYSTVHTSSPYPAKFSTITYYSIRKCTSTPMTQIHHTNNTLHSYLYLTPNLIFSPQILNLANFELGAICADCLGYSAAVCVRVGFKEKIKLFYHCYIFLAPLTIPVVLFIACILSPKHFG